MKRQRPLNWLTLRNLHCFKPAESEKILAIEPEGNFVAFAKCNSGILPEKADTVVRQGKPGTGRNNFNINFMQGVRL